MNARICICCNGIWETTRHNRHNGLLPAPTCYRLATGKLHGVMDFVLSTSRITLSTEEGEDFAQTQVRCVGAHSLCDTLSRRG